MAKKLAPTNKLYNGGDRCVGGRGRPDEMHSRRLIWRPSMALLSLSSLTSVATLSSWTQVRQVESYCDGKSPWWSSTKMLLLDQLNSHLHFVSHLILFDTKSRHNELVEWRAGADGQCLTMTRTSKNLSVSDIARKKGDNLACPSLKAAQSWKLLQYLVFIEHPPSKPLTEQLPWRGTNWEERIDNYVKLGCMYGHFAQIELWNVKWLTGGSIECT